MTVKLVYILVGMVGLVTAAPQQRPDQVVNYDLISSNDTIHDLVEKFLPALLEVAMEEGGSNNEMLQKVAMSFIPIGHYLVELKGREQVNFNITANRKQVDIIESTIAMTMNFTEGVEQLSQTNQSFQRRTDGEEAQEIAKIASAAIHHAAFSASQRRNDGPQVQRAIQGTSLGLAAVLDIVERLSKEIPNPSSTG